MFTHAYVVATSILAILGFLCIIGLMMHHYRIKVKQVSEQKFRFDLRKLLRY